MPAGPVSASEKAPMGQGMVPVSVPVQMPAVPESFAKDAIIAWFRGEFAAANAMIDSLCNHLAQLTGGVGSEYERVFAAIHRRRLNWIPILQMQKFYSIAQVAMELQNVLDKKTENVGGAEGVKISEEAMEVCLEGKKEKGTDEEVMKSNGNVDGDEVVVEEEDSPDSDITDSGSQDVQPTTESTESQPTSENSGICGNHEECGGRSTQIKLTKGFVAKEPVKGHMVNVVKGLKLYENVFTVPELAKLSYFVDELRIAGQNGELSGETFILYNKQIKGNKRELIQFGVPIFGQISEGCNGEPIPALLQSVIDHLIQWELIPEYKKPNNCIINFFDEGEYSQPFLKPPHLEQPISTLLLSESTMAFGRVLGSDNDGNFKGPFMLTLKEGSLIVMRGNSADMARHVMCPSSNKRVSITFFRVRTETNRDQLTPVNKDRSQVTAPLTKAMTLWQPGVPTGYTMPSGAFSGYGTMDVMPKWEVVRAPLVMLAPVTPMVMSPRKMQQSGTGVFLPWAVKSRKHAKHLPPRAQRSRLLALPSAVEPHVAEPTSEPCISIEGTAV
ncbi:hypothetical protein PVL29_008502 [Vitis rotundifolia]|uniref:Fe2OG dioxygenase domain-containing protein n=1 Tax=Vitis rotundifolia TaxID=103349 RepID=A0AA38ZW53_VITRO|nr:hypothetical protein PVL29_008502 [Vitis rotundifolia]